MARVVMVMRGEQNPGPYAARGMNPSSYKMIIGNCEPEVEVTLIPASASFPALLNSNVLEVKPFAGSLHSLRGAHADRQVRRIAGFAYGG